MAADAADLVSLSILGLSVLTLAFMAYYTIKKIWPIKDRLDRFTKVIVCLVFLSMSFEIINCTLDTFSQYKWQDGGDEAMIKNEPDAMRDTRISISFATSVGYSLVFDVYVFRMLLRSALHKNNATFVVLNKDEIT